MDKPKPLVETWDLEKEFHTRRSFRANLRVKAVNGVSLRVYPGETFGLVGESGCGKSTLGRLITRIYEPTGGRIEFDGVDITRLEGKALSPSRRRMQMIFQDPYSSLNPSLRVRDIVAEPLRLARVISREDCDEAVAAMLSRVGLSRADMDKYPHEFSGGQRQRVSIARALITRPDFVLCDEPLSALDVSIQAQVVNLLKDLQQESGLTYLFVAHDLSMVRCLSSRIAVMYRGEIVETAPAEELCFHPRHPYTQALLAAIPPPDPPRAREFFARNAPLRGELSPARDGAPPRGCPFAPRCPRAAAVCRETRPLLSGDDGHETACLRLSS